MKETDVLATKDLAGKDVELFGWVANRRDHGKLVFVDLRDRTGVIQVVFGPFTPDTYELSQTLRNEWVVRVKGRVKVRPEKMVNPEIPTGAVELEPTELEVLNISETPPMPLDTDGHEIGEETRMQYRYLDLRRERMQKNLKLRSDFIRLVREFFFSKGFLEIETPILTQSTPEGSRDFIVPSRLYPGKFFALPQSPQQYKQLLMVAGFERYFQIARCFRDEDLRADRGFEHTQVDLEMSFVDQKDIMAIDEAMMIHVVEALGYKIKEKSFPVFTYQEAMERFGEDKFDLRTEDDKKNGVLAYAWVTDFPFFKQDSEKNWTFTHNPFSHAKPEHVPWLLAGEHVGEILTTQYDLICNGLEVGGGSIRAHKSEMLQSVFRIMGYDDSTIEEQFGHILQAFRYGAPPHGGIAHGVERNIMTLAGEEYLREVQAFPQTSSGKTSVMDAPSPATPAQLRELHLKTEK